MGEHHPPYGMSVICYVPSTVRIMDWDHTWIFAFLDTLSRERPIEFAGLFIDSQVNVPFANRYHQCVGGFKGCF